jgi:hypothetical protein
MNDKPSTFGPKGMLDKWKGTKKTNNWTQI